MVIIGAIIFISLPPPMDLIGLGMIVYAIKKYWGKK